MSIAEVIALRCFFSSFLSFSFLFPFLISPFLAPIRILRTFGACFVGVGTFNVLLFNTPPDPSLSRLALGGSCFFALFIFKDYLFLSLFWSVGLIGSSLPFFLVFFLLLLNCCFCTNVGEYFGWVFHQLPIIISIGKEREVL